MRVCIATVETINNANGQELETLHWLVTSQSQESAGAVIDQRIINVNRTIPSVTNRLIKVELFERGLCNWLARGINCQGHPFLPPLKQDRGGNEAA